MAIANGKAAAIGFIPILVVASLFGVYVALATPSFTSSVSNPEYPLTASTVNSTTGLEFSLSLNATTTQNGEGINVATLIQNVLPTANNVSSASNWAAPVSNLTFHQDGYGCYPQIKFGIFQGYYTQHNISLAAGKAWTIVDPLDNPVCIGINQITYHWLPSSATVNATFDRGLYFPLVLGPNTTITGHFPRNVSISTNASIYTSIPSIPFPVGTYTIAAADEWGQLVILHFNVLTSVEEPVETVSVTGPISPYNPGGPVISLTLENIGALPIVSLNATLRLPSAEPSVRYSFSFGVSSSNPLLPGHYVGSTRTLIGARFDSNATYSLVISGKLLNGVLFNYTQMVMILPPS